MFEQIGSLRSAPRRLRTRICAGLCVVGLVLAGAAAGAQDAVAWRWMPPFHVPVPADWQPLMDDGAVAFYFGRQPESDKDDMPEGMDEAAMRALPFGMVRVGMERAPRRKDGKTGVEAFLAEFERMGQEKDVQSFTLNQEAITIGSRPLTLITVRASRLVDGVAQALDLNVAVASQADADGRHLMVAIAGTRDFYDANIARIKAMLAGADDQRPPPLRALREIPYSVEGDHFMYVFGPAAAPDGVTALGDSRHGRVRVFAADGTLLHEWGEKHDKVDQPATGRLRSPVSLVFGPDGNVHVLDDGMDGPNIQSFTRDGQPRGLVALGKTALGEQAVRAPQRLWVAADGSMTVQAERLADKAHVLVRLAADGSLAGSMVLPEFGLVALMPDGGAVLATDRSPADLIRRFDAGGAQLAEWSVLGTGFAGFPGDKRTYFSVENLDVDGDGRVHAYDRMGRAIWIYDPEGTFLQVVPSSGMVQGRLNEMVVSARGDVLIQDQPSAYSGNGGALRWLESGMPAGAGAPIAPALPTAQAAPADERPAELVALARAGQLTVRALRGFGQLVAADDALALQLRALGMDLYAADASAIETWLQAGQVPEAARERLQALAARMRALSAEAAPAPAAAPCVCVDLHGDGRHSVMRYGQGAPVSLRIDAGDLNACMQHVATMPECAVRP